MIIDEDVKRQKVIKFDCLTSTLFFTRYFFKKRFNRKFVIGAHHRIICDALDKVISGEIKNLIINVPPRYGKTEVAVKNFIAKGLAINPAAKFIHLSYSDDLALNNSDEAKDIVKSAEYRELFDVQISTKTDSKKIWYTTKGGGVYATSAGGQVTGFGAGQVEREDGDKENDEEKNFFAGTDGELFGGALIIDDPIKPEDADNDLPREKVNQRWDSTISNRVNSRKTPKIVIMQRLHERDLSGYLIDQEPGEWTVLNLPAINEDGTALWEFKHTIEELRALEKKNKIVFERQYLQNPKPREGLLFPEDELNYFRPSDIDYKRFEIRLGYGDVADQGDDFFSFPMGGNLGDRIYIFDWIHNDQGHLITEPLCSQKIKENKISAARMEANNQGNIYCDNVEKVTPNVSFYKASSNTNKHSRILGDEAFIKQNVWFLHPDFQTEEYSEAMENLTRYTRKNPKGHDDAPDATQGLCQFFRLTLGNWD